MDTRGYTEMQIKAERTIMALMGEYFDHGILVIKDNGKTFFWNTVGDDDMIDTLSYKAYEDITEFQSGVEADEIEWDGDSGAWYEDQEEED
jgi:hypothetical protein